MANVVISNDRDKLLLRAGDESEDVMTRHLPPCAARGMAIATVVIALSANSSALNTVVLGGLDGPRGLAVGPAGRLIFGEFDGSFSELIARGNLAGASQSLGSVPGTYIAPAVATGGGRTFILVANGAPGTGANTLYQVTNGTVRALADIAAYQRTDPDPYDLADPPFPEESNPFGVAALQDGSALVSDAAGNDLLRVYPNGRIVTVARLKPRVVPWPTGLPFGPPPGTPVPSEEVATSVAVGADGYYYVGELRGFPATPGTSQIWRIAPNSVNALCDSDAPTTGPCQRYADGFTSIVDLEGGPDGSLYVVELAKSSWLQSPLGMGGPSVGSVIRLLPGGGRVELAPGELTLPSGVAVTGDSSVYVTSPVFSDFGPGTIRQVQ
jgi:hypothetical protein